MTAVTPITASDYESEGFQPEDLPEDELTPQFVNAIIERILEFQELLVGYPLHPYQLPFARRIIESVLINDGETLTATAARQSGKSEVVANTVATLMVLLPRLATMYPDLLGRFKDGLWVGLFAPVEGQVETLFTRVMTRLTSPRAQEILGDPEIDDEASKAGGVVRTIRLKKSGSFVSMMTANPKAKIESRTFHLIVIDEAQEADQKIVQKCYAAGTPIWLPDGTIRPVEEVVAQRLPVLTYDTEWDLREMPGGQPKKGQGRKKDTGNLVGAIPVEWIDNGEQSVWTVTLASGRCATVTANHEWVIRERKGNSHPKIRTTDALEVGMHVPLPRSIDFFGDRLRFDDGYFLGQMLGDGCMSGASPMWCGYPGEVMEEMVRYAARLGTWWRVGKESPDGFQNGAFTKPGNGLNGVTAFLREERVWGHKGRDKRLVRTDYSRDAARGILSGLIDSDGCVSTTNISFANISEELVRQVSDLALKFGAVGYIDKREQNGGFGADPHPVYEVRWKNRDAVIALAEALSLREPRKKERLRRLAEIKEGKVSRRRVATEKRRVLDVQWDRIVEIQYKGVQPTYCVTVEPSHLLIVDGFVCRNSISPMLAYNSGSLVLTGTPSYHKGVYYQSIQQNKRRQTGRNSRQQHFEWDWKEVAKVNANYGKFVKKEMLRIGEDSDEFQVSYCGRWILERGMFVTEGIMDHLSDKCLLPGTEVLTLDRGWVPVEGVQEQEFVASMDPVTRVMSFQPVSDTLTYDFDGEVLEIGASDRSLHLTVTPNHNVWATTRKNPTLRKIKAKDLPATARIPQVARGYEESFPAVSVPPRTYRNRQGNYTLSPALYAAILGQWLADGSLVVNEEAGKYIIKVSASRADKVSRIQHLLDEAGIRWWAEGTGKKDICWASKDMALELLPLQGSKNKRIPQEMWRWPQKYLEGLWDGLVTHGDGYWSDGSRTSGVFTTTSQQLADDVAALAVRMGYRANTSFVAATSAYRVNLTNKQSDSYAPRRWVPYSGPIHCLTVPPHHTMLVRQSGRICWTGNSMEVVKHWHKSPVVVGIDPARKLDSTVVTVVWVDWDRPDEFGYYDHRVLNWLELQGEDWEQQYAEITEFLANYDVLAVAVDANGVGDAVAQRLKVLLPRTEVVPITSSLAEQSGRFKHLQALIQRQMIGWPGHAKSRRLRSWKRFMQQMVDAERVYQGANFTVKAPDEAWAHDDYVDSLAIACSLTKEYVMPTVEISSNPFYG